MGDTDLASRGYVKGRMKAVAPLYVTSVTRPVFGVTDFGRSIIESDTNNTLWWTGTVWKYFGNRCLCTSSTRPTGSLAYEGLEIYESDTDKTYIQINGTWVQNVLSTGPQELGYSQIISSGSAIAPSPPVDIAGLSVTVTVGARPIEIKAQVVLQHGAGGYFTKAIYLREGSTMLDQALAFVSAFAAGFDTLTVCRRIAPSAGSHTYKVSAFTDAAISVIPYATPTSPLYIWVREV